MDCGPPGSSVHGFSQARKLKWVAISFSRGSSQTRDQTHISHIAVGFSTSWATKEAQEYWSRWPISSPVDLPDLVIESGFSALEADSLPTQLPGGPFTVYSSVQWVLSGLISEHLQPPSFSGAAQTSSAGQLALTWGPWEVIPVSAPPASSFSTDPEGTLRKQPV